MPAGTSPRTARPTRPWRSRHAALFRRRGLGRWIRHGAALSALAATGSWAEFEAQARWALADRCPAAWLREVLLQSYLFVGYPRAITALQTLTRCAPPRARAAFLTERATRREWSARGRRLCARIYGPRYSSLLLAMRRAHPELAEWMLTEGYGKVLARPFLTPRVRELCVVATLVAQGSWPQLASHLAGALRAGCRPREIAESIETAIRVSPRADRVRARGEWHRVASAPRRT